MKTLAALLDRRVHGVVRERPADAAGGDLAPRRAFQRPPDRSIRRRRWR